jgi:hypothetical protein
MPYTYRASGTLAQNTGAALTVPTPAGYQVGDHLRIFTTQRSNFTLGAVSGWTVLGSRSASTGSAVILSRVADGGADDEPDIDWGGGTWCGAIMEAWHGDVYADQSTIVAHSAHDGATQTNMILPEVTGTTVDNCQLVAFSAKNNTATDATTITVPGSLTKRSEYVSNTHASRRHMVTATQDQTTATDYDGSVCTHDGATENVASTGIIVYLRTASAASAIANMAHYYRMLRA